jgi:hypothetical protein
MEKQNGSADAVQQPRSLAERLEAEAKAHAETEVPAPSSMAERFAPESVPAPGSNGLKPSPLPHLRASAAGRLSAPPQLRKPLASSVLIALLTGVALAPSLTLAALYWGGPLDLPPWVPLPAAWAEKAAAPQAAPPQVAPPRPEAVTANLHTAETVQPKRSIELPAVVALSLASVVAGEAGNEAQFPIALDSDERLPLRSIITIRGLPEGATFSAGRPYGETEWSLKPDEIGDLTLTLPLTASGEHSVSVDLVSADGAVIASGTTRLDIAPDPKTALILRPDDKARIEELIAHGRKMIEVGYLAGARGYFKRAAEAGSAEAAIALGDTYDPDFIAEIDARGIPGDLAEARSWYERAKTLGSPVADERISELEETAENARSMPVPAEGIAEAEEEATALTSDVSPEPSGTPSSQPVPANDSEWVVTSGAVNVRASPTPQAETLKIAQAGTRYRATGRKGKWVQVTDPKTSEVGWVYSRFVAAASAP